MRAAGIVSLRSDLREQSKWHGQVCPKEGAIDMVSIADDVPADTKARVAEIKKGLSDGSFAIWKGPITDNTGKVQIAAGSAASDRFLAGMSFYVRGVEGRVPGGN